MDDMSLSEALALADHTSPLPTLAGRALKRLRAHLEMLREVDVDRKALLRALDVALNGEAGAAAEPGLGDLLAQVRHAVRLRGAPLLVERRQPELDEAAKRIRNTLLADGRNEQAALFEQLLTHRQQAGRVDEGIVERALHTYRSTGWGSGKGDCETAMRNVLTQFAALAQNTQGDGEPGLAEIRAAARLDAALGAYEREAVKHGRTSENAIAVDAAADRVKALFHADRARVPDADAARFRYIVEYNWIGAKTRCSEGIQDGDLESARRAVDRAIAAAPPAPEGDGGAG